MRLLDLTYARYCRANVICTSGDIDASGDIDDLSVGEEYEF